MTSAARTMQGPVPIPAMSNPSAPRRAMERHVFEIQSIKQVSAEPTEGECLGYSQIP